MPAFAALLPVLIASIVPQAEDPIPDRIGLGDLITWAGAGGVLTGIAFFAAPAPKRDKAIRWGVLVGFVLSAVLYFVALIARVASGR